MKDSVLVDGETYYKCIPETTNEKLANNFNWISLEIENGCNHARELYDDFKKQGLSFGAVEAEGYLRAFEQMKSTLLWIKEQSDL
jgi:hypothetical protein